MNDVSPRSAELKSLPAKGFAHVDHIGPYAGDVRLFNRLFSTVMAWARPNGLVVPMRTELITVYHTDSRTTPPDQMHLSVGLTVPMGTRTTNEIRFSEISAGLFFCAVFEIDPSQYQTAWDVVRDDLLPRHRLQSVGGPDYECYLNDPLVHPQGKHIVDIRISVKPL